MNDDQPENSSPNPVERPGLESAMRGELYHILRDRSFLKSPTLSKLLAYLVFETINGNGEKLKSYTVAVDCLGKSPDFDAKSDSYPRVQTMRLRKLLEAFYSKNLPSDGLCLYMVAGSYKVRVGPPETAYPELFRPLSTNRPTPYPVMDDASGEPEPTPKPAEPFDDAEPKVGIEIASILAFSFAITMVVAAAYYWLSGMYHSDVARAQPPRTADVPTILVNAIQSSDDAETVAAADDVFAELVDGLGRSWAVRIHLQQEKADQASQKAKADYQLQARLGKLREGRHPLYLRLTETRSSELVWSSTAWLDPEKDAPANLGPSIAQLASPFGIIAKREAERTVDDHQYGYACLMRYVTYLRTQDLAMRPALDKCLKSSIDDSRLDAVRLAIRSFFLIETSTPENRAARFRQAQALSSRAVANEPKEAYTHFAEARLHYVMGRCEAGNAHTTHAVEANPYDPVLLAILGNFASECGMPGAELLIDQAFDQRTPGETFSRLTLILASIRRNDQERLIALSSSPADGISFSPAYYHLCEALIAASQGNTERAKPHWNSLAKIVGSRPDDPEEVLNHIVVSQQIRSRIISFLVAQKVLVQPSQTAQNPM